MKELYFEDIMIGQKWESPEYLVTRDEIIDFAKKWDPQPFHIDEKAAARSIFKILTASVAHTFAIMSYLVNQIEERVLFLAGLGTPKFEIPRPVLPGDRIRLQRRVLSKHLSRTKPDRGIVTVEYLVKNQDNQIVLDTGHKIMVPCRPDTKKG